MLESKFKKQVGFIKGHSSKKNLLFNKQEENDSSDSFSSFEYNPASRNDQFSPYKHSLESKNHQKSYSKSRQRQEISSQIRHRKDIEEPKFTNLVLRNNFVKDAIIKESKDKIVQKELEKINRKINEVKSRIENQEIQKIEERSDDQTPKLREESDDKQLTSEEELSLSNINRFQKPQQSSVSEALPRQVQQKQPKTIANYKKYLEESSSQEQELKCKKTIKHKENVNRNRNEELIAEWDKRQFKDKSMKSAILEHNKQFGRNRAEEGYVEARGGVYFEVDTKQFRAKSSKNHNVPKKKKKVELNSRQQIIIRRQTAKRYDREARTKLFGYA